MKCAILIPLLFLAPVMAWQGPANADAQEMRETLRFLRLAETKKNLDLPEDKLLAVNDIFDQFEEERFNSRLKERRIRMQIRRARRQGDPAVDLVDQLMALRKVNVETEKKMWDKIKETVNQDQAVDVFNFYETFQRDVQRRIRTLQKERRGKGPRRNRQ
ncbi:MAG: hypothetical protein QNK37_06030 [Acidobacteriota bacterium]|nr:hypothetical protein [Acidobacteriota bacterium]